MLFYFQINSQLVLVPPNMAHIDASGAFTDADMTDVKADIKSGEPAERTLRSARRVFILNLPYELDWFEVKDFFKPATNDKERFVNN